MDLFIISSKLNNDQYANAEEFEKDFRLIFNNCYVCYNDKEKYYMCKTLESAFNKKWTQFIAVFKIVYNLHVDHFCKSNTPNTMNTTEHNQFLQLLYSVRLRPVRYFRFLFFF